MYTEPDFTDKEHEKAWLIRVAVNISKDMQKQLLDIYFPDRELPDEEFLQIIDYNACF